MKRPGIFAGITLASILAAPIALHAQAILFKGELELVTVSGSSCGKEMPPGKRIPAELVMELEAGKVTGYLSGTDIQTGRFEGSDPTRLEVKYPDPESGSGHWLALSIGKDGVTGDLREKPLDPKARGCNFDLGRLTLVADKTTDAELSWKRKGAKFASEQNYKQALVSFGSGAMESSVPFFEEAIRISEETLGKNNQEVLDPCLYLSIAYCALGRFEEGYRLQEKALSIPKKQDERQFLRNAVLVKLFNEQVERLVQESKFSEALVLLEHVTDRYPDLAGIQASRAVVLVGLRRSKEACSQLEKSLKLDPENEVLKESFSWCLTQHGHEKYGNEDRDDAVSLYLRAISLNPKNAEALRSLLVALLAGGKSAEADAFLADNAAVLEKALDPRLFKAIKSSFYREEAVLAEKGGKLPQAETLYRKALGFSENAAIPATELARLLNKMRRYDEAVQLLNDQRKGCGDDHCRKAIDESLKKEAFMDRLVRRME